MKPFWTNPRSFDDVRRILVDIGLRFRTAPLNNLVANAVPSVTDDRRSGYSVGSLWKYTTTGTVYVMTKDSAGSATWIVRPNDSSVTIDSFASSETDATQLIGSGEWVGSGSLTFTATYTDDPSGMTALVTKTGDITSPNWTTLVMDPITGEATVAATKYPDDPGDIITFTLTVSASAATATDTVRFDNTTLWGRHANGQGAITAANLESASFDETSGPSESRSTTKTNITNGSTEYVTFAYPDRLSDSIDQVQYNDGSGYASAAFASASGTLIPDVQTGISSVTNSSSYSENFACVTSLLTDLNDGSSDFKTITNNTTAVNYVFWGEHTNSGTYTESIVEGNVASEPGKVVLTGLSSQSMTVNATASQYTYIAFPTRMGTISSIVIGGFESISDFNVDTTALDITNSGGYKEAYTVVVSNNTGFADPTTMTVTI